MSVAVNTADYYVALTPSDTVTQPFEALYVGGDGNVALTRNFDGVAVTFLGVKGGTILPVSFLRLMVTGTTATGFVGLR